MRIIARVVGSRALTQAAHDSPRQIAGRCLATQVAGAHAVFVQRQVDRATQFRGGFQPADVVEHHGRCKKQGERKLLANAVADVC